LPITINGRGLQEYVRDELSALKIGHSAYERKYAHLPEPIRRKRQGTHRRPFFRAATVTEALRARPMTRYELAAWHQENGIPIKPNAVYRALQRMVADGRVGRVVPTNNGGQPAHVYYLERGA